MRAVLTILETALALTLLAAAAMLLSTLLRLQSTSPGFDPSRVLAVELRLPSSGMAPGSARAEFYSGVLARLARVAGVEHAGFVSSLPLGGGYDMLQFTVPGAAEARPVSANFNIASPGYFRTLGIALVGGRAFQETDSDGALPVIVVNEAAARRFWPGEDPVGRQIQLRAPGAPRLTIVGIVGDVRQSSLGSAPRPEIFLNALQPGPDWSGFALVVRVTGNPAALAPTVKALVAATNPDVVVGRSAPMHDVLALSLAQPRIFTIVLGAFAALALALAAVGLYGVVSYSVTQRTQEFGIRMALGASASQVMRMVMWQGAAYAFIGSALGAAAAVAVTSVLTSLVPGADAGRARAVAAVAAVMLGVALLASYLPARRGARVDPIEALRAE